MEPLIFLLIGLAAIAGFGYMLVQVVRLRLEVWANRRVIAALEAAGHKPPAKKSRLPEMLSLALVLLLIAQLLLLLLSTSG